MAERRWEVPVDVARDARRLATSATGVDAARLSDIGSRMPVGRVTLLALLASGVNGTAGKWATRLYSAAVDQDRDIEVRTLTAAGIGTPCDEECYGIFAAGVDEDVIVQVLRASGDAVEEWDREGWRPVSVEPVGARYRVIAGDTLTATLEALTEGHGLVLRAGTPKAFLPKRVPLTAATGEQDGVYAVVDEVDTTAVMSLFRVADGEVHGRVDGDWEPDSELLPHILASSLPLALVPAADVPVLLRTVDDHDTVYPAVTADAIELPNDDTEPDADTVTPDFSDGVMVALPLDDDTAQQLAVPGGLDPSEMHVTLAYLGMQDDLPDGLDMDALCSIVQDWAQTMQPLSGEVSGPATFEGTDNADNPVQVALADVPGLSEARNSLVDHLASNGVPVNGDHGYTAHLTRAYGADPIPTDGLGGTPLNFGQVGVWHGTDQQNIPLGAMVADFNPGESRDPTGKWTRGGGTAAQNQALEANRKTTAPHAAPKAKTVIAKPYHPPKGGGGGAGSKAAAKKATAAAKAAAVKAAQAKKTALRNAALAKERAATAAETATHQQFLNGQAAELQAEQQRHIDYMHAYASASPAQRKSMRVAESQRQLAWRTARSETAAKESTRHTAAVAANAAAKMKTDTKLKADLAAVDAGLARQFPPTGTPAPAKAPAKKPVHASAEPVVADVAAHTRIPHQLESYWVHGPGAARIRFGEAGDFNRCREQLAKYVHSDRQVSGLCANLHKIAIGVWPGREHGSKGH